MLLNRYRLGVLLIGLGVMCIRPSAAQLCSVAESDSFTVDTAIHIPDSDGDGLPDWWEELYFGGPTNAVADVDMSGDGLTNTEKYNGGWHPLIPIPSGVPQGLSAMFTLDLSDAQPDSDGDGLPDWWEEQYFGGATNAVADADVSGDGLTNLDAYNGGWNPLEPQIAAFSIGVSDDVLLDTDGWPGGFGVDTDGDGMPDWWEVKYGMNPLVDDADEDLDGDGNSNLTQYLLGMIPHAGPLYREVYGVSPVFSFTEIPTIVDTDGDGLPDWWEELYFGGPTNAVAGAIVAGDGLTNLEKYNGGWNPWDPIIPAWSRSASASTTVDTGGWPGGYGVDTDGDGIPDWWEVKYFGGPTNAVAHADPDGDGLTNLEEYLAGSHPLVFDEGLVFEFAHGNIFTLDTLGTTIQTISFPAIGDQLTTNTVLLEATASSGLPVSFTVASGPAVITGETNLSFTAAGEVSIVASQGGDTNYMAAPNVTNTFTIAKAPATVTMLGMAQTYDGTARMVTATTDPPDLAVDITYNGTPMAPTTAGSYAVTGTVNDAMYQGMASGTLTVTKAAAQVFLFDLEYVYDGDAKHASATTMPAGLTVVMTYDGDPDAPVEAGSYTVNGVVVADNWQGTAVDTLTIDKADQTIDFPAIPPQESSISVELAAAASSGLPVDFAVTNGPGFIADGTNLNFTAPGDVIVVASQPGDANWNPAVAVTNMIKVFMVTPGSGPFYGGNSVLVTNGYFGNITNVLAAGMTAEIVTNGISWFEIIMPAASVTGRVDLVVHAEGDGETILSGAYTYNPPGIIHAVSPSNGVWQGGYEVAISGENLGNGSDITNVALSGVSISNIVSQSTNQVIVLAGAAVAPITGDVHVFSTSFGETVKSNAFTYLKADQTISFPAIGDKRITDTVVLLAEATSGLPVIFTLNYGDAVITDGTNLAFTGTGTVSIVASQGGNGKWLPAPEVTNSFTVAETHTLTYAAGIGGSLFGVTNQVVTAGDNGMPVEAVPYTGHHFARWSDGSTQNPRQDTNVFSDVNVTAWFEVHPYTLTIISKHGEPDPTVGVHTNLYGTLLTNTVDTVITDGSAQYVNTGWTLAGHDPAAGTSNLLMMTLTNDAALTWLWATNYWLDIDVGSHGSVNRNHEWVPARTEIMMEAIPHEYFHFDGWLVEGQEGLVIGDNPWNMNTEYLDPFRAHVIKARFAPNLNTNTATPEWWLARHGFTNFIADAISDPHNKGMLLWQEYLAGTNPKDPKSIFQIKHFSVNTHGYPYCEWIGGTNGSMTPYIIQSATNIAGPWHNITNAPRVHGTNAWTGEIQFSPQTFFRVRVDEE